MYALRVSGRQPLRVIVHGLQAGQRRLDQDASHYLARVHRVAVGGAFVAVDPVLGLQAGARVDALEGDRVLCSIEAPTQQPSGALDCDVELWVGMLKGDKLDRVINAACQLGVSRLTVFGSSRAVVRAEPERVGSKRARWQRIAAEAVRQSGRPKAPELVGPVPWPSLIEEVRATRDQALGVVLDPRAPCFLPELLANPRPARVRLLVGPEGGLSAEELLDCTGAGFRASRLGPYTLRSETAAVAAVSIAVACLCLPPQ